MVKYSTRHVAECPTKQSLLILVLRSPTLLPNEWRAIVCLCHVLVASRVSRVSLKEVMAIENFVGRARCFVVDCTLAPSFSLLLEEDTKIAEMEAQTRGPKIIGLGKIVTNCSK